MVLREKLKRFKHDLKVWNKEEFDHVNQIKQTTITHIGDFDKMDYSNDLYEKGMMEWKKLFSELKLKLAT